MPALSKHFLQVPQITTGNGRGWANDGYRLQGMASSFQAMFDAFARLFIKAAARQQLPDRPGCNLQVKKFGTDRTAVQSFCRHSRLPSGPEEAYDRGNSHPGEVSDGNEKRQGKEN